MEIKFDNKNEIKLINNKIFIKGEININMGENSDSDDWVNFNFDLNFNNNNEINNDRDLELVYELVMENMCDNLMGYFDERGGMKGI